MAFDLFVKVRPNISRPSSYADLRFLNFGPEVILSDVTFIMSSDEFGLCWNGEFFGGGAGAAPLSSLGRNSSSGTRASFVWIDRNRFSIRST